jgi:hypothetical protein
MFFVIQRRLHSASALVFGSRDLPSDNAVQRGRHSFRVKARWTTPPCLPSVLFFFSLSRPAAHRRSSVCSAGRPPFVLSAPPAFLGLRLPVDCDSDLLRRGSASDTPRLSSFAAMSTGPGSFLLDSSAAPHCLRLLLRARSFLFARQPIARHSAQQSPPLRCVIARVSDTGSSAPYPAAAAALDSRIALCLTFP